MGHSFGGLGVLADIRPFDNAPISVIFGFGSTNPFFGGMGLATPQTEESMASVAGAVGLRGSSSGTG
jgi:hypothetical protein